MISERMKQRLIGGAVLVALAVIFIPVLFNLQPSRPLDRDSLIPPAPEIEPVTIDEPVAPEVSTEVHPHEDAFAVVEPREEAQLPLLEAVPDDAPLTPRQRPAESADEVTAAPATEPALAESGLPDAWVVQVASYSEQASARQQVGRLQEAGYKAFSRQGVVAGDSVFRVFVGPFVARRGAEEEKELLDASLGVDSLILSYEP